MLKVKSVKDTKTNDIKVQVETNEISTKFVQESFGAISAICRKVCSCATPGGIEEFTLAVIKEVERIAKGDNRYGKAEGK